MSIQEYSVQYHKHYLLCVVEDLEYCLHALIPDGRASHGVEDLIERTKQSLNKHITQCGVFPHRHKPGILLRVDRQTHTHTRKELVK